MFTLTLMQAEPAAKGGFDAGFFIMIAAMIAIIVFFMIIPQRKQQKKLETFRNNLKVGDKVYTSGGVHGTVKSLNEGESYLTIEVAKGVAINIDRNFVYEFGQTAAQQR